MTWLWVIFIMALFACFMAGVRVGIHLAIHYEVTKRGDK